ncbi:hypothetical protein PHMEG_0008968 [Phytophthora megakarya]|uniref:Uncharacterized protein n=1 Tax=Phytophthora megakarya TaxID=4795 RepID=A0A225WJ32_9STRA|nr:hypothetical protein PHMEG_0008968 [Phytophthora megakarya]
MITTCEVGPCESKMMHAKFHVLLSKSRHNIDHNCSQIDDESRKELVRRGAVGRRFAVVALSADTLAAIAEISELKW